MKASELRIGNLFYPTNINGGVHLIEQVPFVIMEITQNEVRGYIYGQPIHQVISYTTFNIRHVNPIPLTEEWFIRFGGIDHGYHISIKAKRKVIKFEWSTRVVSTGIRSGWRCTKYPHIKHVHQLQNLYFALTGEEL